MRGLKQPISGWSVGLLCLLIVCSRGGGAEPTTNSLPELSIQAAKVRLEPGTPQTFEITLRNTGDVERAGALNVWVDYGVAQTSMVKTVQHAVKAGTSGVVTVEWKSEKELWGCSVLAEWNTPQGVLAARDTFSVTKKENIWAASPLWKTIGYTAIGNPRPRLNKMVDDIRREGALFVELFNWQTTHFGGMLPLPTNNWVNGMSPSGRAFSTETIRFVEERVHQYGMAFITYGIIEHCGPVGYEWTRQHPEDVLYPTKEAKNTMKPEYASTATANSLRRETLEQALREYVAVARELKFDGIRWDGHPGTAYHPLIDQQFRFNHGSLTPGFDWQGHAMVPEDPDELNLEIDRVAQDTFRRELPGFLIGYNYSGFSPPEYSPRNMLFPRSFALTCAGNMILDEKQMNTGANNTGVPGQVFCRTWTTVRSTTLNTADIVHSLGGHPYRGPISDANNAAFRKICYSTIFASATHVASAGTLEPEWGQFVLRYNRLLFHPSLARARSTHFSVPVQVTSNGPFPVIYQDYIYSLYTGGRYFNMVHLLNDPGGDEVNLKLQKEITWPVTDAVVNMKLPRGLNWSAMKFYALSPEFEGWRKELVPKFSGTSAILSAPEFKYWCIVVMDIPVTEETILWDKDAKPWLLDVEQDPVKSRTIK